MKSHPRWSSALAGILLLFAVVAPTAHAEPDPPEPAGPTLSLSDLGFGTPLAFFGDQGTAELTFPVPRGLAPVALNARVELPVNVRSGVLTVMQRDRTIARVPLAPTDLAPIVVPLAGAAVEDNAVTVTLRTYLVPEQGYCLDPTNPRAWSPSWAGPSPVG